jgi:hypothetical protein
MAGVNLQDAMTARRHESESNCGLISAPRGRILPRGHHASAGQRERPRAERVAKAAASEALVRAEVCGARPQMEPPDSLARPGSIGGGCARASVCVTCAMRGPSVDPRPNAARSASRGGGCDRVKREASDAGRAGHPGRGCSSPPRVCAARASPPRAQCVYASRASAIDAVIRARPADRADAVAKMKSAIAARQDCMTRPPENRIGTPACGAWGARGPLSRSPTSEGRGKGLLSRLPPLGLRFLHLEIRSRRLIREVNNAIDETRISPSGGATPFSPLASDPRKGDAAHGSTVPPPIAVPSWTSQHA